MKFGVKNYDNEKFFNYLKDKADFIETMAIQGRDYSFLKDFPVPVVIHAEHQAFGINPADLSKREENLNSINFAKKIADLTGAKKIIVHPGIIKNGNKNCSMKNAVAFFKEIKDDRILVENLFENEYGVLNGEGLCGTPWKTKRFLKKTGVGFCFDINHAIAGMKDFKENYNFIRRYLKLNPAHYHIGGQKKKVSVFHLYFKDSELDLKKILSYYPKDIEITLETGTDEKIMEEDLETIRKVVGELS